MHLNSKLLFQKYAIEYFRDGDKVLEIGPSGYPSLYSQIVNNNKLQWHTLDIGSGYIDRGETNPLHIVSESEYDYPVADQTFDIVLSGQVMEHVKEIWTWLKELKRITRKGGHIIIISPISWSYHEAPVDCWRIYPEGMKALMQLNGLNIKRNLFESIEKEKYLENVQTIPGNSCFDMDGKLQENFRKKANINKLISSIPFIRRFVFDIPVAYDNICVVQK